MDNQNEAISARIVYSSAFLLKRTHTILHEMTTFAVAVSIQQQHVYIS